MRSHKMQQLMINKGSNKKQGQTRNTFFRLARTHARTHTTQSTFSISAFGQNRSAPPCGWHRAALEWV
jgi:hypothetical protein